MAAVPLLLMPKKPKEAPSASACASRTSVWDGMRTLVRNAQFWTIAIITSFNAGMFFSISVTVVQAAAPYGYTESQTGLAGSLSAIAGYLGGGNVNISAGSIYLVPYSPSNHHFCSHDRILGWKKFSAPDDPQDVHANALHDLYNADIRK